MKTKKVFEEVSRLGKELKIEEEKIEMINSKLLRLTCECQHEIIFKYRDNHPRKLMVDGNYYCPACGRTIMCIRKEQLRDTCFSESRIIPLTNLSLFGTKDTLSTIKEEVLGNFDFYYDKNKSKEELSSKMESILKEKENRYENPTILMKVRTRNK